MWCGRSTVSAARFSCFALLAALVLPASATAASPGPAKAAAKSPAKGATRPPAKSSAGTHRRPTASTTPSSPRRATPSLSVGSPTDGRLVGGVRIAEGPHLRVFPSYAGTDIRYGLDSLVAMIDHAARAVRKQFPDAVLTMGQLSKAGGGQVDRHASHESGRDADVGFYVKSTTGKPLYADHMVVFTADGKAPSWPGAVFDDAKNWALVAAMLGDTRVRITHIFVATHLRARLLAYAAKIGAPPALRRRASEVLAQPRGSLPHDDHFHVRIACPSHMSQCVEWPMRKRAATARTSSPKAGRNRGAEKRTPKVPDARTNTAGSEHDEPRDRVGVSGRDERDDTDRSIPSLAPSVAGLDSVVIPASLDGVTPARGERSERARGTSGTAAPPVDDPDGVLDTDD